MSKPSVPWSEVKERLRRDPEFVAALEELEPEYQIARQLIRARLERGMTQKQLAVKIGTGQSAISRMESGEQNVSIGLLKKAARGLNTKLHLTIG